MRQEMRWILLDLMIVTSVSAAMRPHIILIVADDMGWNDVSLHGADQIPTPNIDALAFSGVYLQRHYVLPSCTPSRTALMTGQYPIRTGMQGFPTKAGEPRAIPLEVPLLPQQLNELGYTTRMIGKWHLGCMKSKFTPTQRGFDSHYGYWNGYIGYFNHNVNQRMINSSEDFYGHDFWRDLEADWNDDNLYATTLFTEEAEKIISQHNKSSPLFLYMAHLATHAGAFDKLEAPSEEEARKKFSYITDPRRQIYADMVRALDDSVGRIVTSLKEADMLNNAIIVFMSDNGGMTHGMHANTGSNWPFRGMKFTNFEGGVHGVAAVWSPLIKTRRRLIPHLMHMTDWFPTLYHAAGGDPSSLWDLDGIDQWEQLTGNSDESSRMELLVHIDEKKNMSAFIRNHWKLVRGTFESGSLEGYFGDSGRNESYPPYDARRVVEAASIMGIDTELNEETVLKLRDEMSVSCQGLVDSLDTPPCPDLCLFDLAKDPCETTDVASNNSKVVEELQDRLNYFNEILVPQIVEPVDIRSDPRNFNNTWVPWLDYVNNGYSSAPCPFMYFLLIALTFSR